MKRLFLATVAAVALPTSAFAATLTVGAGSNGNAFPFGVNELFGPSTNYQQVYASNQFAGPMAITALQFRKSHGGNSLARGTWALSLSTTDAAVDGLSIVFADNLGSNNTQVFSGELAPNFDGTLLTFNFSQAFNYNPGQGNLLLDLQIPDINEAESPVFFLADSGNAIGVYSRMHNFGGGFDGFGLQTGFTFTTGNAVPEPATWAMMIAGFGLVGGAMRRRQSVRVTYA